MNRTAICVAVLLTLWGRASAQISWRTVVLHEPTTELDSSCNASSGTRQGGYIVLNNITGYQPAIWNGSATDYTLLTPPSWRNGWVNGMSTTQQVGVVSGFYEHAALWSGTAESFVDLTPTAAGYTSSAAYAVHGNQQVGTVNSAYAALWRGSAASFVRLHPFNVAKGSFCGATDGEYQGGSFVPLGSPYWHAALWHGTAASMVDLNPAGSFDSGISGMVPGVQVGDARFLSDIEPHAALWHGTAASFQDLHPPGAVYSKLYATTGTMHVGTVSFGGFGRAGIWLSDSPSSFVNLHNLLGPGYAGSEAYSISVVNNSIYVVGTAGNSAAENAVLWIGTIPAPATLAPLAGGILVLSARRR